MTNASTLTIDRSVTIERPLDEVFALYTQRAATWWPFQAGASHNPREAVNLTYEPRPGGRVYETWRDGTEVVWGHVLSWDAPRRFSYSYRPFADERLTEVELSFEAVSEARTQVRVQHRGWEAHGQDGVQRSDGYNNGWKRNLERLAEAARTNAIGRDAGKDGGA
jgi:uncharacterized protein YndB with AHSA1/START domain